MPTPRSESMHGGLVDRIGAAIVHGEYAPGERLLTGSVADDAGSSRSTAREAVRVLESLGLVRVRRRAGIEVLPPSSWNVYAPEVIAWRLRGPARAEQLHDLSQLRGVVEPLAAELAAGRASEPQRQALMDAVAAMTRNARDASGDDYLHADARFHRTLLEASGNSMLAALSGVVEAVLVGRTRHHLMPTTANLDALRWHQEAALAIANGDGPGAADAVRMIVAESDTAMQQIAASDD